MYNTLTGMSRFNLFPQGNGRLGINFIFDQTIVQKRHKLEKERGFGYV
jgi:hypothetical protein